MRLFLVAVFLTICTSAFSATKRVFYENTGGWGTVYAYTWTNGGTDQKTEEFGAFPGKTLTTRTGDGYYYVDVESDVNIIFSDGTGGLTGNNQTSTLSVENNRLYKLDATYESVTPETEEIVIYAKKPTDWGTPYAYVWNSAPYIIDSNTSPGTQMTPVQGETNLYQWVYNCYYIKNLPDRVIFSDNGNSQSADTPLVNGMVWPFPQQLYVKTCGTDAEGNDQLWKVVGEMGYEGKGRFRIENVYLPSKRTGQSKPNDNATFITFTDTNANGWNRNNQYGPTSTDISGNNKSYSICETGSIKSEIGTGGGCWQLDNGGYYVDITVDFLTQEMIIEPHGDMYIHMYSSSITEYGGWKGLKAMTKISTGVYVAYDVTMGENINFLNTDAMGWENIRPAFGPTSKDQALTVSADGKSFQSASFGQGDFNKTSGGTCYKNTELNGQRWDITIDFINKTVTGRKIPVEHLYLWQSRDAGWSATDELEYQGNGVFTKKNVQFHKRTNKEGVGNIAYFIFNEENVSAAERQDAKNWGAKISDVAGYPKNAWYYPCQTNDFVNLNAKNYQIADPGKRYDVTVDFYNETVKLVPADTIFAFTRNTAGKMVPAVEMKVTAEGKYRAIGVTPLVGGLYFDMDRNAANHDHAWGPDADSESLTTGVDSATLTTSGKAYTVTDGLYDIEMDLTTRKVKITSRASYPSKLVLWQSRNQGWDECDELEWKSEGVFEKQNVLFYNTIGGVSTDNYQSYFQFKDESGKIWGPGYSTVPNVPNNAYSLACKSERVAQSGKCYQLMDPGQYYDVTVNLKTGEVILKPHDMWLISWRGNGGGGFYAARQMTETSSGSGVYVAKGVQVKNEIAFDTRNTPNTPETTGEYFTKAWGPVTANEHMNADGTSKSFGHYEKYYMDKEGFYDFTIDFNKRQVKAIKKELKLATSDPWCTMIDMRQETVGNPRLSTGVTTYVADKVYLENGKQFMFTTDTSWNPRVDWSRQMTGVIYGPTSDHQLINANEVKDLIATNTASFTFNGETGFYKMTVDFSQQEHIKVKYEPVANTDESSFKFVTFNSQGNDTGATTSWWARRDNVKAFMEAQGVEILGLQEVLGNGAGKTTGYMWDDLKTVFPDFDLIGRGREAGKEKTSEGVALMFDRTKWGLLEEGGGAKSSGTFWLSDDPDTPGSKSFESQYVRTASWAKLYSRTTGVKLFVAVAHLDIQGSRTYPESEATRKQQVQVLHNQIAALNTNNYPIIVCGDFNTEPQNEAIEAMMHNTTSGLDFYNGYKISEHRSGNTDLTLHNFKETPTRTIDYVFVQKDKFRVTEAYVPDPKYNGAYLSDHSPVVLTVIPNSYDTTPGQLYIVNQSPKVSSGGWDEKYSQIDEFGKTVTVQRKQDKFRKLTKIAPGVYKGKNIFFQHTAVAGTGRTYSVVTAYPSNEWREINLLRYGASASTSKISLDTKVGDIREIGDHAIYDIPQGIYNVTVDLNTGKITLEWPENMYAVGRVNDCQWNLNKAIKGYNAGGGKYYFAYNLEYPSGILLSMTPTVENATEFAANRYGNETRTVLDANNQSDLIQSPLTQPANEEYCINLAGEGTQYGVVDLVTMKYTKLDVFDESNFTSEGSNIFDKSKANTVTIGSQIGWQNVAPMLYPTNDGYDYTSVTLEHWIADDENGTNAVKVSESTVNRGDYDSAEEFKSAVAANAFSETYALNPNVHKYCKAVAKCTGTAGSVNISSTHESPYQEIVYELPSSQAGSITAVGDGGSATDKSNWKVVSQEIGEEKSAAEGKVIGTTYGNTISFGEGVGGDSDIPTYYAAYQWAPSTVYTNNKGQSVTYATLDEMLENATAEQKRYCEIFAPQQLMSGRNNVNVVICQTYEDLCRFNNTVPVVIGAGQEAGPFVSDARQSLDINYYCKPIVLLNYFKTPTKASDIELSDAKYTVASTGSDQNPNTVPNESWFSAASRMRSVHTGNATRTLYGTRVQDNTLFYTEATSAGDSAEFSSSFSADATPTSAEPIWNENSNANVYGTVGAIIVRSAEPVEVQVQNVSGVVVYRGNDSRIETTPGIYVVCTPTQSYKVVVR